MLTKSNFKPAWWLRNRHAQTIWQTLFRRRPKVSFTRERFELDDGDFLDIDASEDNGGPIVIFLHGLEGSREAKYILGAIKQLQNRHFTCVLMYHRSCSGEINRLARSYHSGFTGDARFLISVMRRRHPQRKIAVVAYSLGGSILLNLLGRFSGEILPDAAVAVSVPFKLQLSADQLNTGFARLYRNHLVKKMINKVIAKEHLAEVRALNLTKIKKCRDFNIFDNEYTAPVNGFSSNADYYRQSSSFAQLKNITTPTLIVHAMDDPFMTPEGIPYDEDLSTAVSLELSEFGGHVGFVSGGLPGVAKYWLEDHIARFLLDQFK